MRRKILAVMMVVAFGIVSLLGNSTVQAKKKTSAMVIANYYYGSAYASITSSNAAASTSFGSPVVQTGVSAVYRYKKANGSLVKMNKSASGKQTCSVALSHSNAYSVISDHTASCSEGSSKKHIEIVY